MQIQTFEFFLVLLHFAKNVFDFALPLRLFSRPAVYFKFFHLGPSLKYFFGQLDFLRVVLDNCDFYDFSKLSHVRQNITFFDSRFALDLDSTIAEELNAGVNLFDYALAFDFPVEEENKIENTHCNIHYCVCYFVSDGLLVAQSVIRVLEVPD